VVQPSVDELTAFGLALRTLRQRAQLSQEELAHVCGLHRTYVGSVERGERNISLLNIHVLARALNTSGAEMLHAAETIRQKPDKKGR
jgi:transcriptional regulator with XRE-family HTH domain